jgi:hypothetical protein
MADPAGTDALITAIKHLHGCTAIFVESVPVRETFNGEVVWDGEVQVFALADHPKAKRAYAWSYATEGERRRFMAVLGLPPVTDAVTAVRVAIAASS